MKRLIKIITNKRSTHRAEACSEYVIIFYSLFLRYRYISLKRGNQNHIKKIFWILTLTVRIRLLLISIEDIINIHSNNEIINVCIIIFIFIDTKVNSQKKRAYLIEASINITPLLQVLILQHLFFN